MKFLAYGLLFGSTYSGLQWLIGNPEFQRIDQIIAVVIITVAVGGSAGLLARYALRLGNRP